MVRDNFNDFIKLWLLNVPGLSKIPFIGPLCLQKHHQPLGWQFLSLLASWLLYKTRFGLRLRSVGENPQYKYVRLKVYTLRYSGVHSVSLAVLVVHCLQSIAGNFSASTIVGQGYMSMAR